MNWGFTQTGKYVLTVRGQLTDTVGGTATVLTSPTYRYTFCVIDETGASPATILRECGIDQGVATPTPTATATNTPAPTNTPTATATNTPLATTATPTNTPVPTTTGTPTNTPLATATATNTPVPPTRTPTATATNTLVPMTRTPTATVTNTSVPTATPTSPPPATPMPGQPKFVWSPPPGIDAFVFHPHPNAHVLDLLTNNDPLGTHPAEDVLFVANNTQFSTTDYPYRTMYTLTAEHPVLGGMAGDTVWVLPIDFTDYAPGIAADLPSDAANWNNATLILESVEAPSPTARFAIWAASGIVRFRTTGDTTTPQTWDIGKPADWHINWGFTEQGLYTLRIKGQITGPAGTISSKTHTYQFCVIPDEGAALDTLQSVCGLPR